MLWWSMWFNQLLSTPLSYCNLIFKKDAVSRIVFSLCYWTFFNHASECEMVWWALLSSSHCSVLVLSCLISRGQLPENLLDRAPGGSNRKIKISREEPHVEINTRPEVIFVCTWVSLSLSNTYCRILGRYITWYRFPSPCELQQNA
jgi:hypothetical protein